MNSKRKHPDRPVALHGKIVLEFFQNEDEEFKWKSLKSLCKEVTKELGVSCVPVEEHLVENPERGAIALALCATNMEKAKRLLDQVTEIFDTKAPARIVMEEISESEIL